MSDLLDHLAAAPERCPSCGVDPCACEQLHIAPAPGDAAASAPPFDLAILARIWASPAIPAFLNMRAEQWLKHGHSPDADLAAPNDRLVRAASERLRHALDKLTAEGGDLPYALRKIEVAGACLMAAHDQLSARRARLASFDGAQDERDRSTAG